MARLYHSSSARETSLTAGINSSATTLAVDNPVGYPADTPFVILVELGTSSEEIMLVTAVVGSNWTVTRGYDGSTAVSHDLGAKIVHGVSAGEIDAANAHIEATTNVHGLSGGAALVGTTNSQTLSNKTLTSPTINGGTWNSPNIGSGATLTSPTLVTPTIASFVNAQHDHSDSAGGGTLDGSGSQFYFPAPVTSSDVFSLTGFEEDLTGMSITYTAPAAWPANAKRILYNVMFYFSGSNTMNLGFVSDASTVLENTPFRNDDVIHVNTYTLSYPGPLTTVGVSHTAKVKVQGVSGDAVIERAFWMSLV